MRTLCLGTFRAHLVPCCPVYPGDLDSPSLDRPAVPLISRVPNFMTYTYSSAIYLVLHTHHGSRALFETTNGKFNQQRMKINTMPLNFDLLVPSSYFYIAKT